LVTNNAAAAAAAAQGDVLGIIMRRHDALCGLLVGELSSIKGHAATADAQLTVLANWIEDQVRQQSRQMCFRA
jgi:hypothetical protein